MSSFILVSAAESLRTCASVKFSHRLTRWNSDALACAKKQISRSKGEREAGREGKMLINSNHRKEGVVGDL